MDTPFAPIEVFYSFAETDAPLLEQLEHHLSLLQRRGIIAPWHKRQIHAGYDRQMELDAHLNTASLILLLISPDFLASDYCYETEMQQALQRHEAGEARVIPILLRPVDWASAPFTHLQALPTTGKAITLWNNQDEAWVDVAQEIRKTLEELPNGNRTRASLPVRKKPARPAPFPPVWNVPYRYSFFFTGREHVVEKLFTNFTTSSPGGPPLQALSGLGGLGKTQTAVEYAYRYRQEYQTVLWMDAETAEDLLASFKTAAELLKRPTAHLQNMQSLLASMHEWLRNTTDWLLILDNADNLAQMEPFLPQSARGHLLLTTRATAMGLLAQPLALPLLPPDDGALCLLRRANAIPWTGQLSDASPASVKAARELSQLMDGLPLALEQAGAYIETTGRSVSGYLELYRTYRSEIQREQHGPVPTYREPVAFAWNIARKAVQDENPAAIELLHLCAFLAPHGIPYDLFTKGAPLLGPTLGPVAASPLALDRAIALLRKHSLVKNEVDRETDISRLIIHPVLQEVLRNSMDAQTWRLWAERTIQIVTQAGSLVEGSIMQAHLRHATLLLEEIENG
ncbi:MAG TPA: TIR domain-containing protein [Ktedonobacteraceae bacterium]|nr:TIR domain-containing protein [Ktedonobacteraceae bacterium]